MGIAPNVANAVVREHAHRPITGDVLQIGRLTMFFSPATAVEMVRAAGLPVPDISFESDGATRQARSDYISDRDFWRLLGINTIRALDVSDYEGADIVHDLTQPLPPELVGSADFILDGSTLDNVFDPAAALRNMTRLLRPGGRMVSINMASNDYGPYLIFTPHWFLDFFAVNRFADAKVYLCLYNGPRGRTNVFTPDLSALRKGQQQPDNPKWGSTMGLIFIAETGPETTWERSPVQLQYREDWSDYAAGIEALANSTRPALMHSTEPCFARFAHFHFVGEDGKLSS